MRIKYINSLRLVATLCVVFLHTSAGMLVKGSFEGNSEFWLSCYKFIMQFSVPLFVMISGALFLNPNKEASFQILIRKYVKRIALALLVFGLPMCLIEVYFNQSGGVMKGFANFLTGHSWDHMWYLYMLLGLYLITPIIKPFVVKATGRDWMMALGILFVLSSLLPTLNDMGVGITGYMIASTPFPFIYLLGYWLCWKASFKVFVNKPFLITIILLCLGIIVLKCYWRFGLYGYADPVVICLASSMFLLFKSLDVNWNLANRLAPYCFGIYLVHPVFINFAYKFIGVEADLVVPIYNFIGFFMLFVVLSLCSTYILMKIPFLKKHVL